MDHDVAEAEMSSHDMQLLPFRTGILKLLLGYPGQIGPDLVYRPPEQLLHPLFRQPTTSTLGTPASSRRTTSASGSVSPVCRSSACRHPRSHVSRPSQNVRDVPCGHPLAEVA